MVEEQLRPESLYKTIGDFEAYIVALAASTGNKIPPPHSSYHARLLVILRQLDEYKSSKKSSQIAILYHKS